jgi:hypothetical protein
LTKCYFRIIAQSHAFRFGGVSVNTAFSSVAKAADFRADGYLLLADSVEKVGFSARLNSGKTTTEEPTHHVEWFLGSSLIFAALLLGWFEVFCFV